MAIAGPFIYGQAALERDTRRTTIHTRKPFAGQALHERGNDMTDYRRARQNMVDSQLRPNGVRDTNLLRALHRVPREVFVPASLRSLAYAEEHLAIKKLNGGARNTRYMLAPLMLARLIELLRPQSGDVALDVGCATGYSTSLLAAMTESVVALESDPELAAAAAENLNTLNIDNAAIVQGPLAQGCPDEAPFDVIFVNGSVDEVPQYLLDQLAEGGRLAAFIREPTAAIADTFGYAYSYEKSEGWVSGQLEFSGGAPMLPGFERPQGFSF
jgi:protein-L-isoaspartate(D-aspartate) O-methyltransferase